MAAQNSIRLPGQLIRRLRLGGLIQQYQQGGIVFAQPGGRILPGGVPPGWQPGQPGGSFGSDQTPPQAGGGLVGGIQQQLGAYNQQFVQPVQAAAGQVGGFNPFGGPLGQQAQATAGELLRTGAPTDVSGLTQVAQQRAGRTFEDFLSGARERFGALNLESSSALEQAKMREAARLAQGVGEQGIISGVGAAESATGRRLAALSPFQESRQQQLGAQTAAGGLYGQAAGLGFNPIQGGLQLSGQLFPAQAAQVNQPFIGGNQPPPTQFSPMLQFGASQSVSRPALSSPAPAPAASQRQYAYNPNQYNPFAGSLVSGRTLGFQDGGRVDGRVDFGDYLSNLLFGQQFTRPQAQAQAPGQFLAPRMAAAAAPTERPLERGFEREMREAQLKSLRLQNAREQKLMNLIRGISGNVGTGAEQFFAQTRQQNALRDMIAALTGKERAGTITQAPAPTYNIYQQPYQQQQPAQKTADGGTIQGPSYPPDTVPVLAQGGEVILPLETVARIQKSKSKDPLIQEIKRIARRTPDQQGAQLGGKLQDLEQRFGGTAGPVPGIPGATFDLKGGKGGRPLFTLTGTPEPLEAIEERRLQDAITYARANVNRLKTAYALGTKGTGEQTQTLIASAQQELDKAQQDLVTSRTQALAKEQAAVQKEQAATQQKVAEAQKASEEARKSLYEAQAKAAADEAKLALDQSKSDAGALKDIIINTARQGGSPFMAAMAYYQVTGKEPPPGLVQAAQQEQQQMAAASNPAPVTEAILPEVVRRQNEMVAAQQQQNLLVGGHQPAREPFVTGPVSRPGSPEVGVPGLEVPPTSDIIHAILQNIAAGDTSPENALLLQYYASPEALQTLPPEERTQIVEIMKQLGLF